MSRAEGLAHRGGSPAGRGRSAFGGARPVLRPQQGSVPDVRLPDPPHRAFRPLLLPGRGRRDARSSRASPSDGTLDCPDSSGTTLRGRQVVILYAVGEHFRQTNAIEGLIGEGTGGVTEGLRRRIVLPHLGLAGRHGSRARPRTRPRLPVRSDGRGSAREHGADAGHPGVPLWFVEGMAEYLSLGPIDAQTAMWLRDAALREKLPHIQRSRRSRILPVPVGPRLLGLRRREVRRPRRRLAGAIGRQSSIRSRGADDPAGHRPGHAHRATGTPRFARRRSRRPTPQSAARQSATSDHQPAGRKRPIQRRPRVSPDGRWSRSSPSATAFPSSSYLADVATGRVDRKLLKSATDPHFDSLEFLIPRGPGVRMVPSSRSSPRARAARSSR